MESFLGNLKHFFKLMPDYRPRNLENSIRPKCKVLYFPLEFPDFPVESCRETEKDSSRSIPLMTNNEISSHMFGKPLPDYAGNLLPKVHTSGFPKFCSMLDKALHILWPHRWEHDKDPETFFSTLFQLQKENIPFKLSVLGESYLEVPEIFKLATSQLKEHIIHYGFISSREEYWKILWSADVVVSTARHEFFGVAMLEAVYYKCYPLCPKQLVYPEIFPEEYLYSTPNQLYKRLKKLCLRPHLAREHLIKVDLNKYMWSSLKQKYCDILLNEY